MGGWEGGRVGWMQHVAGITDTRVQVRRRRRRGWVGGWAGGLDGCHAKLRMRRDSRMGGGWIDAQAKRMPWHDGVGCEEAF